MTYEWRKLPSVTPGGKAYFWIYYKNSTPREKIASIVWNRAERAYAVEIKGTKLEWWDQDQLSLAKKHVELTVKAGKFEKQSP